VGSVPRDRLELEVDLHDRVELHGLLAEFRSTLLDAGCSVKELQVRLGHASARETLDTYSHLMPHSDDRTREAIAANIERIVSLSCPPGVIRPT
jgi:integrase